MAATIMHTYRMTRALSPVLGTSTPDAPSAATVASTCVGVASASPGTYTAGFAATVKLVLASPPSL